MRSIILQHMGYDSLNGETWLANQNAYLLTPKIVLSNDEECFDFYYLDEAIADDQQAVTVTQINSKLVTLHVDGSSVKNIELSSIAKMSIVELAETLAAQEHLQ